MIESLKDDWNGFDTLDISIKIKYEDEELYDSIKFPINVKQVNDMPLVFDIEKSIEDYGIDPSAYYYEDDTLLFYRYPFVSIPTDSSYTDFLLHWDRTSDIDTDSTLNKDMLFELFYRIELFSDNDDMVEAYFRNNPGS